MKTPAMTRYKYKTHRGKTISNKEKLRRVAQSLGYRHSVADMPQQWFDLMARGGITFDFLERSTADSHNIKSDVLLDDGIRGATVETKTLQL